MPVEPIAPVSAPAAPISSVKAPPDGQALFRSFQALLEDQRKHLETTLMDAHRAHVETSSAAFLAAIGADSAGVATPAAAWAPMPAATPIAPAAAPVMEMRAPDPVVAPIVAPAPVAKAADPAAVTVRTGVLRLVELVVSEKTGYPPEVLGHDMDLEAELGIDSIKQVEILSALRDRMPGLPEIEPSALAQFRTIAAIATMIGGHAPAPAAPAAELTLAPAFIDAPPLAPDVLPVEPLAPARGNETLLRLVEAIVSEKTGYPAEVLGHDMDLEAELGIDSIKQVEILSALRDRMPGLPEIDPSALAQFRTIAAIATMIGGHAPEPAPAPVVPPPRLCAAVVTETVSVSGGRRGGSGNAAATRRSFAWSRPSSRRRPGTRPRCWAMTWILRPNSASTRSSRSRSSRRSATACRNSPRSSLRPWHSTAPLPPSRHDRRPLPRSGADAAGPARFLRPGAGRCGRDRSGVDDGGGGRARRSRQWRAPPPGRGDRVGEDRLPGRSSGHDMDLEAELGIDSIKQVEILSALRDRMPGLPEIEPSALAQYRTIGAIAAMIGGHAGPVDVPPTPPGASAPVPAAPRAATNPLSREVYELVESPATGLILPGVARAASVTITGGRAALREALARRFEGRRVAVVEASGDMVVFLGGLEGGASAATALDLHRAAFESAKAAAGAFGQKGGAFIAVQDCGGDFGYGGRSLDRPWFGGVTGLVKTAAREWPAADVKAIDIATRGRSPRRDRRPDLRRALCRRPRDRGRL